MNTLTERTYDLVIIGSGPAGMTAGIYAKRYMMDCIVIGPEVGGIATEAHDIENWPGFKGAGSKLMGTFSEHLKSFGAEIITEFVKGIAKEGSIFRISTENRQYMARTVLIATGTKRRKLEVPGEKELFGKGVSYCATCDCAFFKDRTVAVIGGGDAAAMAAQILSQHASKVYIIYRQGKDKLKAEPARKQTLENDPKIEFIFNANVTEIMGEQKVEKVKLDTGAEVELDGVFIEIGGIPTTALAKEIGIELAPNGRIKVGQAMDTNIEGVFAAGDITTGSNQFNQIVTAASEGAIAALSSFNLVRKQKHNG